MYLDLLLREIPGEFGIEVRRRFLSRRFRACGRNLRILEGVRFRGIGGISIGDNVGIGTDDFLQGAGGITIGDSSFLGPGVKIWSASHVYADVGVPVQSQGYEYKSVDIGDDVWIGAGAFIMPGARIGKGCVISAGAVVAGKEIPPYSILAGNPARLIGRRDGSASPAESKLGGEVLAPG